MLLLQANTLADAGQPSAEVQEESLSIMDLIFNGGLANTIIIGILFLMLAMSLYIYFERSFAIGAAKKIDSNFMNVIRDNISSGRIEAAKNLCYQYNNPVARLVAKGISRIGKPIDDIHKAIENAGSLEVYKLEKNVSLLATLAGVGPMIGFLGTVVGMVMSFHAMATSGGQADMSILAGGIYTAMTTTVAGLIVGIVAYLAYNHLVMRINNVTQKLEATTVDFLDMVNEPVSKMSLKSSNTGTPECSMSSMTDIVFLLLIFFMLTASNNPKVLDMLLPKAHGKTSGIQNVAVSINKDLQYFVNNKPVATSDMESELKSALSGVENPTIILRVEESVPIENAVLVMDIANQNQYKLILAVRPK